VLCTALAATLSMVLAASASATPKLAFTYEGALYSGPNITAVAFEVSSMLTCVQYFNASNTTDKAVDTDTLEELIETPVDGGAVKTGCRESDHIVPNVESGAFTKLKVMWNEQVTTAGKVTLHESGPCVYEFSHLLATLHLGFFYPSAKGSATGSLVGKESNLLCSPLQTVPWSVEVVKEVAGVFIDVATERRG
jgi:hypothetical protein